MKLELKHLSPYLPYGLRLKYVSTRMVDRLSNKDIIQLKEINEGYIYINGYRTNNKSYIPILRPLSDLTKEINLHDDFFAIPIENMTGYKLEGNISDAPTTVQHLYKCSKGEIEAKFLDYWVIVQLLEWHFDIFNLIKNNLAIDINTIK